MLHEIIIFSNKKEKEPFTEWLETLDKVIRARILSRLLRLSSGNFGDSKLLDEGVYELRFTFGAGYRVYYGKKGKNLVVLLVGGDKKTQKKDIRKAVKYWKEYNGEKDA